MKTETVDGPTWLRTVLGRHGLAEPESTPATAALPRFQRDAAVRLLGLLEAYGGALLADDVGLGKTHIAGAVIRSLPDQRPALILAPAAILPAWRRLLGGSPALQLSSLAKLSRGTIDEARGYRLIVVDEAHRFRNPRTKRYRVLMRLARGARLLLVTATPIHNRAADVAHLLELFLPGAAAASNDAQRLRRFLEPVMVRRTRWTVARVYPPDGRGPSCGAGSLPQRRRTRRHASARGALDALGATVPAVARALMPDAAESRLRPLLVQLLLKRVESSPAALLSTLRRGRNYLLRAREAADRGASLSRRRFRTLFGDDPDAQRAQLLLPFYFDESATGAAAMDRSQALATLDAAIAGLRSLDPREDPKLTAVSAWLESIEPSATLVMTTYRDTARYLFRALDGARGLLTGSEAIHSRVGRLGREQLLAWFAPGARGLPANGERRRLLVATDVLGEGVDLQDAARLVHYDRPWNPMAIEQREGRLDRLGSPHDAIDVLTLQAPESIEPTLRLERRLRAKQRQRSRVLGRSGWLPEHSGVGLDWTGFLQACAARAEGGRLAPLPVETRLRGSLEGWLLALSTAADATGLQLIWADKAGVRFAPPARLLQLAAGRLQPLIDPPDVPPLDLWQQAAQLVRRHTEAQRLAWLEPVSPGVHPHSAHARTAPLVIERLGFAQLVTLASQ